MLWTDESPASSLALRRPEFVRAYGLRNSVVLKVENRRMLCSHDVCIHNIIDLP